MKHSVINYLLVSLIACLAFVSCNSEIDKELTSLDWQVERAESELANILTGDELDKYLHDETYVVSDDNDTVKVETRASQAYLEYARNYRNSISTGSNKAMKLPPVADQYRFVGVVPAQGANHHGHVCGDYQMIIVHYDAEDNRPTTKYLYMDENGFKADPERIANVSWEITNGDVDMRFCRVPAILFPNNRYYYAVLALDDVFHTEYLETPYASAGFYDFVEVLMDADDNHNNTYVKVGEYGQPHGPRYGDTYWSEYNINVESTGNLRLPFLVFAPYNSKSSSLPDLGFSYAVFGQLDGYHRESIVIDDEDKSNINIANGYDAELVDGYGELTIRRKETDKPSKYNEDFNFLNQERNTQFFFSIKYLPINY